MSVRQLIIVNRCARTLRVHTLVAAVKGLHWQQMVETALVRMHECVSYRVIQLLRL